MKYWGMGAAGFLAWFSAVAFGCGEQLAFKAWLDRNQAEFATLERQFGAGIAFRGYLSWLNGRIAKPTTLAEVATAAGISANKLEQIRNKEGFPSLEEHWKLASSLGVSNLEAAFVIAATHYWADVAPPAVLRQNLLDSLDRFFSGAPAAESTTSRWARLRAMQIQVDAKMASMFGLQAKPSIPEGGGTNVLSPSVRWIQQGIQRRVQATWLAGLAATLGLSEEELEEVRSGKKAPSANLLKQLALEFGEPIHTPFVILAFERDLRADEAKPAK